MALIDDKNRWFHRRYLIPVLVMIMVPQTLWACMPHSPSEVFIGRVQAIIPMQDDNQTSSFNIQFSSHRFVFHTLVNWFLFPTPKQWQGDFSSKNIQQNDLFIGLSNSSSGDKSGSYHIYSLASLRCENDTLTIGKPLSPFIAWDRENGSCRHDSAISIGLLDGFLIKNQTYYLQKLQKKYPTCSQLKSAFPITLENVNIMGDEQSLMNNKPTLWQHFKQWLQQLISYQF